MTTQQYRNQFEDQVKDLIKQYAATHGHAPDVMIEWGKATPTPEDDSVNIIDCPNCGEKWNTGKHNACQCGAQLIGEHFRNYPAPEAEVVPTCTDNVKYEIDFDGHILTRISINRDRNLSIEGCMNGYGDGLSSDRIVIKPVE